MVNKLVMDGMPMEIHNIQKRTRLKYTMTVGRYDDEKSSRIHKKFDTVTK